MATYTKGNIVNVSYSVLGAVLDTARHLLKNFNTEKSKEFGLCSKTYQYGLEIGQSGNDERKVLARLKTLFSRYLSKNMPYLAFTQQEYIQFDGGNSLCVCLGETTESPLATNPEWVKFVSRTKFEPYELVANSSIKPNFVTSSTLNKKLQRYVRFLNYIFRKNGIPIQATVEGNYLVNPEDSEKIMRAPRTSDAKKIEVRGSFNHTVKFSPKLWLYRAGSDYQIPEDLSQETMDTLYARESAWAAQNLTNSQRHRYPGSYKFAPEKIFLNLDKVIKIFTTLTRKTTYGSSAFDFRAIPGA